MLGWKHACPISSTNSLPTTEQKQIEQHLAECAQCRANAESLRWTIGLLKQAPVPTSSRVFVSAGAGEQVDELDVRICASGDGVRNDFVFRRARFRFAFANRRERASALSGGSSHCVGGNTCANTRCAQSGGRSGDANCADHLDGERVNAGSDRTRRCVASTAARAGISLDADTSSARSRCKCGPYRDANFIADDCTHGIAATAKDADADSNTRAGSATDYRAGTRG